MTGRGAWWLVLALLLAALLAPLSIADVPPILDYPNHLARFVLLAAGPDDPVLGPVFTPSWTIIPNLAADVIGPPLLRLLPVHVAGRMLLGGILMLNLAGVLALHRALFGGRSFWPLASGLVAYNSTFLLGFLNWQIGSGLAMLFAAAWLRWRERRPATTIAGAAAASVVLFFCHPMGLAFFVVLIGGAEVHAVLRGRAMLAPATLMRTILIRAAALLPVLAGPLLLWLLAPLRDAPAGTFWMSPHEKLVQAASPFINYIFPLDVVSAALVYGGVALGVAAGCLAIAPRAVPAVAMLAVLYVMLPFALMSGAFLDTRVAIMLGFLLFAAVDPVRLPRRTRRRDRHRPGRAVRAARGRGCRGLVGASARPRRPAGRHRGRSARRAGVRDQRATGGSTSVLGCWAAQQADLERFARGLSPARAAAHRAPCILADPVRQSGATTDPPAPCLCQAGSGGT